MISRRVAAARQLCAHRGGNAMSVQSCKRRPGALDGILVAVALVPAAVWAQEAEKRDFQQAVQKSKPKGVSFEDDGVVDGKLGTGRMRRANRVAAQVLEERMRRERPDELKLIREAGAADVVVVRGSYDRVQDVLRAVGVKHVVIPPHLLKRVPLMSTQTLMVNCPGHLSKAAQERVARFVKTGGYLVTTDWALSLVQRIFPGYIARGGRNTGNDVVLVHVHDHKDPMLKHVRTGHADPRWWLESSSYPIRVLDQQKVSVLISSQEMRQKYGHAAIAVTFRHDDGKVLHMTSHFYLQQAKLLSKRDKAKGSSVAAAVGLTGDALKRLRAKGLDEVQAGEVNAAYSMQQVTSNVLVNKAQNNRELLKKYDRRARRQIKLQAGPRADVKTALKDGDVGKDYVLRVLKKEGKRVKVRDLFGREGWTDADALY
jgi:hypothetical protein